ncbi:hypothetical protein [Candidatus Dormibacter sp.]|uniref:hypothetical protein n=1 Tax=Candidatus Dormibacter sp. TaxID=2973982 RepID=UPI00269EF2B5
MSRGPTRRVSRLVASGAISEALVRAAEHEADLLAQPYISLDHVQLARLRRDGLAAEYNALRGRLTADVPRRWWRPLGPRSALRRRGRQDTEAARLAAEHAERGDDTDRL